VLYLALDFRRADAFFVLRQIRFFSFEVIPLGQYSASGSKFVTLCCV